MRPEALEVTPLSVCRSTLRRACETNSFEVVVDDAGVEVLALEWTMGMGNSNGLRRQCQSGLRRKGEVSGLASRSPHRLTRLFTDWVYIYLGRGDGSVVSAEHAEIASEVGT